MRVLRLAFVLFFVSVIGVVHARTVLAVPGAQDERILSFDSHVTVNKDASLTVREVIKVRCARKKINHGIYRDFPVVFAGGLFMRRTVGFKVKEVLRDGKPEAWHTKTEGKNIRVYMGKKDVLLKPGVYTYSLTYKTDRQLGFFKDHDELYWNVTGND